jgi:guanylate kinase
MVLGDAFLEWAHVHGHRYGTSKKAIEDRIAMGADVILEIDFQGALQIKKIFANAVLIFMSCPQLGRASIPPGAPGRGRAEVIELRLSNAALEMAQARNSTSL